MSDKMNYCIDCVSYFLNKEKNRYFCADKKTRIEDVPCEFFEQRCDDDIDNPWHTGTPTEEGDYVVFCQYRKDDGKLRKYKTVFEFKNGEWIKLPALEGNLDEYKLIAWYGQKIEPYEEAT